MNDCKSIEWNAIKVVIFDVDGTLYAQSRLRTRMLYALLRHYALRPWKAGDLMILQRFRAEREKRAGYAGGNLESAQYNWCAEKGGYSPSKVRRVIEQWMFIAPNPYLAQCTYPGTHSFFAELRRKGIKVAIYSDYKAHDKMLAMSLEADLIVSSTDPEIDRLKPDPTGLLYVANKLQAQPQQCLFIGDRQEMDGECAIRAGMPYLILDKKSFHSFDFYQQLELSLTAPITT